MNKFEYKVVPAPRRGEKAKGVKTTEARFAHTLEGLMNELGAQGWEYQRADTLPSEERSGFTSKTTVFQNLLVFRRLVEDVEVVTVPDPAPISEPDVAPPLIKETEEAENAPPVGPAARDDKPSDNAKVAAE